MAGGLNIRGSLRPCFTNEVMFKDSVLKSSGWGLYIWSLQTVGMVWNHRFIGRKKELHTRKWTVCSSELETHVNVWLSQGHSEFTKRKDVCPTGNLTDWAEPHSSPFVEIITVVTSAVVAVLQLMIQCGKALAEGCCATGEGGWCCDALTVTDRNHLDTGNWANTLELQKMPAFFWGSIQFSVCAAHILVRCLLVELQLFKKRIKSSTCDIYW